MYLWRCRQLYNAALEQRIQAFKRQSKTLTEYDQQKDLSELHQNDPDFKAVPTMILRSALKRLNLAYKAFFRRIKAGEKPGFPRFKGRDQFKSFSFMAKPSLRASKILVPKLGYVKFHKYRELQGEPLDASIRRDGSDKWWVCIQCDLGEAPPKVQHVSPVASVGIDVGLTTFAMLSTGEAIENPRFYRKAEALLTRRQQALARSKRGSKARQRRKQLVAKAHEHIRNQRLDHARKIAVTLFTRFDFVAYEDLNVRGMVHGNLAKSIHDASWGTLIHAIVCKAESAGKWEQKVNPRGTSQRCSRCGKEPAIKKTLADRVHECPCGPPIDRDLNAALNIVALGLSALEAA
jgi:putative transposase